MTALHTLCRVLVVLYALGGAAAIVFVFANLGAPSGLLLTTVFSCFMWDLCRND